MAGTASLKQPPAQLTYPRMFWVRRKQRASGHQQETVAQQHPKVWRGDAKHLGHGDPSDDGLGKDAAADEVLPCQVQAPDARNRHTQGWIKESCCILIQAIRGCPPKVMLIGCRRPDVNIGNFRLEVWEVAQEGVHECFFVLPLHILVLCAPL